MLYSLAVSLYALGVVAVSPFHKKARLMVKGHGETFRILREKVDPTARYVWFHAASLGEFEQGRPLMERFRRDHPEYKILLTFFSPSGYEVRKNYEGADIVCYLPFDSEPNVKAFLHYFVAGQIAMLFLVKYEFWYNLIHALHKRGIPVYSVSSIFQPNKVYFRWYGHYYSRVLNDVEYFFVQDEESRELLATKGIVDNVDVVGDTRMDRVLDIQAASKQLPLVEKFSKNRFVLVAGSSWGPDENLIINYFNCHADMKLILAPHVIDESHLLQIEQKLQRPSLRYSQANEQNVADADCLIINCFGLLSSIYRYGEVAYVGGGFGAGIHNVPEAAVYGVPVMIGPNNKKFREAQDMLRLGGCIEIHNQQDFDRTMQRFTADKLELKRVGGINKRYITENAGASDKIFRKLGL